MRKIILALDSSQLGGIETHVLTLAIYLQSKGYDVAVWFIRGYPDNPLYQQLDEQNITYQFSGSLNGFWRRLRWHRNNIILHTHGYKAGIAGRLFARLLGIPVLSTYHSGDVGTGKLRLYSYLDQLTSRLGERIAVSELIKGSLPPGTKMLPNFIDMPEVINIGIAKSKSSANPLRVAFVGRLSVEKGPDQFCQLAALWHDDKRVKRKGLVEFVIYGDGPEGGQLMNQYHKCVQFKGHVHMPDHWQDVDLLCISSRHEGLPYVALEAMALGIPLISFDVGGLGSLISDASLGWLVDAGNVVKLKQALWAWYELADKDKVDMANHVREKIRQHYCTSAVVPSIEAIYHSY